MKTQVGKSVQDVTDIPSRFEFSIIPPLLEGFSLFMVLIQYGSIRSIRSS